jgi:acyltransferase
VGVLFLGAVLLAPIVWAWPADRELPIALAGFVNGSSGSYFPLLPWAGFTYAGVMVAFVARHAERPSVTFAPWLLGLTVVALGVPVLMNRMGVQVYGAHDFWRTDPYYFFFRLGNVTGVLTVLAYLERGAEKAGLVLAGSGRVARALGWVRVVGEQSLVVYVAHLVILHGWVVRPGLASSMGHALSLGQCTLVALSLFGAMVLVARAWSDMKKSRLRFQAVQLSAAGAIAYLVLIAR